MVNILIQAFSCNPNRGGEFAVSWGWIKELNNKLKDDDRIYIVQCHLDKVFYDENSISYAVMH